MHLHKVGGRYLVHIYRVCCWALSMYYHHTRSNFWKFYLIRTGFIFGELVFLMKVFRLEQIFLVFRV